MNKHRQIVIIALFAILALTAFLSLAFGTYKIPIERFFEIIRGNGTIAEKNVFFGIRLPRLILGIAVGGSLALAGVLLQAIFRNPLVEPYTIGISGGASFAVCLAVSFRIINFLGHYSLYFSGFFGASIVLSIFYLLKRYGFIKTINTLLLCGIMASFVFSSLIMLVLSFSKAEEAHGILFWLMGALDHSTLKLSIAALGISIFCLICVFTLSYQLDALLLGEEQAFYLGINVEKAQFRFFFFAALLTSAAVSLSGIVGFVGLSIPILIRRLIGNKHKYLLPSSFLGGAAFLSICDFLARTLISPRELPVGVITGLIGGSVFIWAILNSGGKKNV